MKACSLVIRAFNEEQYIGLLLVGVRHQTVQYVEPIRYNE
jgi:glycosyltransferase involved in cell wall biosynthesis